MPDGYLNPKPDQTGKTEKVKPKSTLTKTQIEKMKRISELEKYIKKAPGNIRNNASQLARTYLHSKGKNKEQIKVELQNIRKEIGEILKKLKD